MCKMGYDDDVVTFRKLFDTETPFSIYMYDYDSETEEEKYMDVIEDKYGDRLKYISNKKKGIEMVKRMIDEGHILGNHGMTHASLPTLSDKNAKEEIMSLHDYVSDTFGYQMQYFRCPCGEYSEHALEIAKECGYKSIFWSSAYVDWNTDSQPSPAEGLKKLSDAAHGGEILLLHSVSATNAEILGDLIDNFRAKGFTV